MSKRTSNLLTDHDKLVNADRAQVATLTVQLFNTLHGARKENQLLALAAAFVLMGRTMKANLNDAYTAVTNLMWDRTHADRMDHRFAAMEYHLKTELTS